MIVYRIFQCEILFLFLLQIQLGPSEFLTGVSGTIGPFKSLINVITSLTFVTNTRSYGPFGKGRGTPFHIQMQNNDMIIDFFGRSIQYLNAIGVYTNQDVLQILSILVLFYLCFHSNLYLIGSLPG